MDFTVILGQLAPLIVIGLVQLLKKWISSRYSPLIVLGLGGLSTLLGVGPAPGGGFIDSTINVAWVSGLATLLYDLFKKLKGPGKINKSVKSILILFMVFSMVGCGGLQGAVKQFSEMTPKERATFVMSAWNANYRDAVAMSNMPNLTAEVAKTVRIKKQILTESKPLVDSYVRTIEGGGTPDQATQDLIMQFLNKLGVKLSAYIEK